MSEPKWIKRATSRAVVQRLTKLIENPPDSARKGHLEWLTNILTYANKHDQMSEEQLKVVLSILIQIGELS